MPHKLFLRHVIFTLSMIVASHWATCQEGAETIPDHISQPIGPPPVYRAFEGDVSPKTIYRIEANPDAGFYWPYYIAVPSKPEKGTPILVEPNNDGKFGAPFKTHEYWASIINEQARYDYGEKLGSITLTPVFPRPRVDGPDHNLYTHALSRAAMTTGLDSLKRLDLQLLAMIDDVRKKLDIYDLPEQVFLWGFSAAGDFVTRMTLLHPERVKAIAAGGLGGFPMLPVDEMDNEMLVYPVGTSDFQTLFGKKFNIVSFRKVPMLLLQGDIDENDSVPEGEDLNESPFVSDSYSYAQSVWINKKFGELPVDRIERVSRIYDEIDMSDFYYHIEPGVEHTTTKSMEKRVLEFFLCTKDSGKQCAK